MANKLYQMTPKEIVGELDKYIIGQDEAKKSVAIALRNRYRRSLLSEEMQEEITPKNILMMGPTGVGKTEIARRLVDGCSVCKSGSNKVYRSRLCGPGCGFYGKRSGGSFHPYYKAESA